MGTVVAAVTMGAVGAIVTMSTVGAIVTMGTIDVYDEGNKSHNEFSILVIVST